MRVCLIVGGILAASPAPAQQLPASKYRSRATDSLRVEARNPALPDSQRVLTLMSLGQEYFMNDNAASIRVTREALELARAKGFVRGELIGLSNLARTYAGAQELPQAERWAQEMRRRAWVAPPNLQRFRIVALHTLASVAVSQGNTPRALSYFRQTLPLMYLIANRPSSDFPLISYGGLSELYTSRVVDDPHPADSLVRAARYYTSRLARMASAYVTRFGADRSTADRRDMLANAYVSLAQLSDIAGHDSAAYYFSRAVPLYRALGYGATESQTHALWATSELRHRRYQAAQAHARQALHIAHATQNSIDEYQARDVLAEALAATGQPAEAYQQARRARRLHDSLETVANHADLQNLQVRFDTQRKEDQIQELTQQHHEQQLRAQQQRQRLWMLGGLLIITVLGASAVGVLALRLRRSRAQLAAQHQQLALQNEELVQTRAAQDRLYALVAHDLRSPVVAFAGLADLLNRYVQRQDTQRLAGLGGRIRQAAQNLSELLDNLLNWAVSQRGELTPQPRPLRATELLAEIADLYQNAADAAEVSLTVEAPADLLLQADPDMTRTILRNLTGNALKATPTGGHVHLRAERQADGIHLLITDTGQGLDAQVLAQLSAGPRLHVASKGRGAGLGLLLSRNFAEAQGGQLVLANLPDGTGTVATLTLPQAA